MIQRKQQLLIESKRLLEERVIFGMNPDVVLAKEDKKQLLKDLTSSYLFKDILSFKDIRNQKS